MKKKIYISLGWIFVLVIVSLVALYRYYRGYATAENFDGYGSRIPLWYPYQVVDYGFGRHVCVDSWEGMAHELKINKIKSNNPTKEDIELQSLSEIDEFNFDNDVLYGRRFLRSVFGECLGVRYFVFSRQMKEVAYYTNKEEFANRCRILGVDINKMKSFAEHWMDFHNAPGKGLFYRIYRGLFTNVDRPE